LGKTVDEVLVVPSSRSLAAVDQQQFYVSISRGRERCQIFTDDTERLRSQVTHSSEQLRF
jgi:ATP-dependent exoDNAse (exonuclease V) alpha subunit